jgi:putative ABC transport system substrate-binding protein
MRRRDFITLIGGAAAARIAQPRAARAQSSSTIGVLSGFSAAGFPFVTEFRRGLKETGYVEGENLTVEYRWADGEYDRLPALAADLVRRQVAVILAAGSPAPALAAKAATATIPIVFAIGVDPVQYGLVASFNRPGGNVTGVNFFAGDLGPKRLGLLRELLPNVTAVALLVKSDNPIAESVVRDAREAARLLGLQLSVLPVQTAQDLDAAFASIAEEKAGAVLVSADAFFVGRIDQFVRLAARYRVPAIYFLREFAAAGGLMSYGTDIAGAYRQVGTYAGKILKGTKPADLPVQQVARVEFVINLKTAKTLGLTFPITLLGRADEVIE